jgi:hypothetical protein
VAAAAIKTAAASPSSFPNAVQPLSGGAAGPEDPPIMMLAEDGSVKSQLVDHNGNPLAGCVPAEVQRMAAAGDVGALDQLNANIEGEVPEGERRARVSFLGGVAGLNATR